MLARKRADKITPAAIISKTLPASISTLTSHLPHSASHIILCGNIVAYKGRIVRGIGRGFAPRPAILCPALKNQAPFRAYSKILFQNHLDFKTITLINISYYKILISVPLTVFQCVVM